MLISLSLVQKELHEIPNSTCHGVKMNIKKIELSQKGFNLSGNLIKLLKQPVEPKKYTILFKLRKFTNAVTVKVCYKKKNEHHFKHNTKFTSIAFYNKFIFLSTYSLKYY